MPECCGALTVRAQSVQYYSAYSTGSAHPFCVNNKPSQSTHITKIIKLNFITVYEGTEELVN